MVSGAQVALFSLNTKDLNMLKLRENNNARLIPVLLERPRVLMASLLITSVFANIAIVCILNYLLNLLVNAEQHLVLSVSVKIVVISLVLLLCVEVLPKVYGTQNNIRMAIFTAPLARGLQNLLEPLSNFSVNLSDWLSQKVFGHYRARISAEDIDEAIELSVNKTASQEEKNILRSIVRFGEITVKQIMHTRLDVSGVDASLSFRDLIGKVGSLHYSRLPVYRDNLDNITGMIYTKDLIPHLDEGDGFDWHQVVRPAYFVHEQKLIEDLLKEFQAQHMHFAVVVDEFGGTSGIVTLEDIMEEIIGEIRDEFDEEEFDYQKVEDNQFIFEGKTMLNDLCRILEIPADSFEDVRGESDSLGGLILEIAGGFPEAGSVVKYDRFDFTIVDIDKLRIGKVKVTINPEITTFD